MPVEVLIRVFSYLSRNDLNYCSLVCKQWEAIIERHKSSLALHKLDCIKFTSLSGEWKVIIEYGYLCNYMRNKFKNPEK